MGTPLLVRVGQAQFAPVFGDYAANVARFGELASQALDERCDLLVLPETSLSGYFLEGAVLDVARTGEEVLADLAESFAQRCPSGSPLDVLVGFYELFEGNVFNAALYATLGAIGGPRARHIHRKMFLPTYGVFDEQRFVARGRSLRAFTTRFGPMAILICEDVWHSVTATILALRGARFIHAISSSPARGFGTDPPWNVRKWIDLLQVIAEEHAVFVTHTARVGFENGKGFGGGSAALTPDGAVVTQGPTIEEALLCTTFDMRDLQVARVRQPLVTDLEAVAADLALELGDAARHVRSSAVAGEEVED